MIQIEFVPKIKVVTSRIISRTLINAVLRSRLGSSATAALYIPVEDGANSHGRTG
jgi:hypothetical protein